MKLLLLGITLIATPACGREINQTFITYVNEFTSDTNIVIYSDVTFDDDNELDPNEVAACIPAAMRIIVSKHYWDMYKGEDERREIIYHELAHCELGAGHDDRHDHFMHSKMASPTPDREKIKAQVKGLQ